ncbi:MAG: hypothetical protein ACYDBB_05765 [Armatimonadota bacterium]
MTISAHNRCYLAFMKDIYDVSLDCETTTYIWGGFTLDIFEGQFLRDHHDLDGFTLNLLDVLPDMMALYEARGYTTEFREDFDMLSIRKDDLHATFNRLEVDGETAMWRHIGNEGTVYFSVQWLDKMPRHFYEVPVFTAGIELDYTLKTNISMIHPEWTIRDKDYQAIERLEMIMAKSNIDPEDFLTRVWSYMPILRNPVNRRRLPHARVELQSVLG